jgi:hypothetical protein
MTTQTQPAPVTARTCTPEGRVTRSLLGYGPLAGAVFVGSIFIQGLTRRGLISLEHRRTGETTMRYMMLCDLEGE